MSFKEATELRKAGKLAEALEMASQDLEKEPNNIWNKRSLAWVYSGYLKTNINAENFDVFYSYLVKIKEMELSETDNMLYDQCAWQVGLMVFALCRAEEENSKNDSKKKLTFYSVSKDLIKQVNSLFEIIKTFHFTKPSEGFSYLLKAFHKAYKDSSHYIEFADWWGFENFRKEDFQKEEFKGKSIMSVAEQAYIGYSRKLLEGEIKVIENFILPKAIDKNKIIEFLPKLDIIIEEHPEYQYPPYFKAKLLLALGDKDNILESILPFVQKKRNDFWVWDLLSDIFPDDDIRKTACLCRALMCVAKDDFLVKIRQKLTTILIQGKQYIEAKTEIENIVAARKVNGWNIPKEIVSWQAQSWYSQTQSQTNNKGFYQPLESVADEILFSNIPEVKVAVEFVNAEKKILTFVASKTLNGSFNYGNQLNKVNIGDILKVRFKENSQEGHYRILTAKTIDEDIDIEAIKDFSAELKIIPKINIGFAKDVFIDPKMISQKNLQDGQIVSGKAILSYNKKKEEWGWKAIVLG